MLSIGTIAPEFELLDEESKLVKLSHLKGKYVLLYFYPKDDTPGCTKEACQLKERFTEYETLGVVILGVSHDKPESHKDFIQKYDLPFSLLSDPSKEVIKSYEARAGFLTRRISYLIDKNGMIAAVFPKVDPATHALEVLEQLRSIVSQK